MSYTDAEAAVVAQFVNHFDELNADRCKAGELDAVLQNLFASGERYACILQFGGGIRPHSERFNRMVWEWNIGGIMMIKFNPETIEVDLRVIVDKLKTVFDADRRLGGTVDLVSLSEIEMAEPAEVNEVPFYWLPFSIAMIID